MDGLVEDVAVKLAVMGGDRPDVDAITTPANLVSSFKRWITLCWHQEPCKRPSFDSKLSPSVIE